MPLLFPSSKPEERLSAVQSGEKLVWLHFPFSPSLFFGDQISVSASEVKEVVEEEALQFCQSRQGRKWECSVKVCTEVQEDNVTRKREMEWWQKLPFSFAAMLMAFFCSCCVPL